MNDEFKAITNASLILSANRALLSEVRPNMRKVSVDFNQNDNTITLYIYLDGHLTEEESESDFSGIILAEMMADFPQEIDWKDEVIIIPYPNEIPKKGICVFQRYEPID